MNTRCGIKNLCIFCVGHEDADGLSAECRSRDPTDGHATTSWAPTRALAEVAYASPSSLLHSGSTKLRYRSFNPFVKAFRPQAYDAHQIFLPPFQEGIRCKSWAYTSKPRSYPLPTPVQEGYTTPSTRSAGRPPTVAPSEITRPGLSRLQRAPRNACWGGRQQESCDEVHRQKCWGGN